MKTNNRLVLLDNILKTATVYEDRRILEIYNYEQGIPPNAPTIEWARTQEYKSKA